jgi:hypothetical protein
MKNRRVIGLATLGGGFNENGIRMTYPRERVKPLFNSR